MPAGTDKQHVGQDAGGTDNAEHDRVAGFGVDDDQQCDEIQPVADGGNELADEQSREGRVAQHAAICSQRSH